MVINYKNYILFFIIALTFFVFSNDAGADIKNSVSATADTGGNTVSGNGNITTGDAKATVKSQNIVNGGENVQNKVEAKAEAQGDGATASVEVNGEKKSCVSENGEGCEVEINNSTDNSASASVETENMEKTAEEKNESLNMLEKIESFAKNIISEIGEWFT